MTEVRGVSKIGSGDILASVSNLLSGESKTAFDSFRTKVNSAGVINGNNPGYLLDALGQAGGAIADVLAKTLNGARPTQTLYKGITVVSNIQGSSPQRHTYTVQQDVPVTCKAGDNASACTVNVDLTMVIDFPNGPTGAQSDTITSLNAAGGLRVNITKAVLKNAYLSATVQPLASGGHLQFSGLAFSSDTSAVATWKSSTALSLNFSNMAINLPLTLQQLGTTDPVTMEVAVTSTGNNTIRTDVAMLSRDGESRTDVNVFALQGVDINATAKIKDATQSMDVTKANLKANGTKVAVDPDPFDDVPAPPAYVFSVSTVDKETTVTTTGETAAEFLNASVDVAVSATVSGVDPIGITATAQRASNELFSMNPFKVVSEEGELTVSGNINLEGQIRSLRALDEAGLELNITSTGDGPRSGTLVDSSGRKVADVEEDEDGKIVIKYVDGTSVTL